jgi:choline dehydrogenase
VQDKNQDHFDYIVVGAGSAGCVLANRLTENGNTRTLLLEAGGNDRSMLIHIPIGFSKLLRNPKVNWLYQTEADGSTNNRVHAWPRGKVLGGSSSINGLVYVRGQAADYDAWGQLGLPGWSWDEVLPYFMKAEHQEREDLSEQGHGKAGPLTISEVIEKGLVSDACIDAFAQAGVPPNHDLNSGNQEGVNYFPITVKNGRRASTAVAYLNPAKQRSNLRVEVNAMATQVLFEGKRAVGIQYRQDNQLKTAYANKEVILSGGAVNSPQLLELSGVGQPNLLNSLGIDLVHALPGVGENLQDHYSVSTCYRLLDGTPSINTQSRGLALFGEVLKYFTRRRGLLTNPAALVAGFARTRAELATPDVQFHALPGSFDPEKRRTTGNVALDAYPGLLIQACQLRPESRGTIHISSADPNVHPSIVPNYLRDSLDQQTIIAGIRLAQKVAQQPALRPYVREQTIPSGQIQTDAEILDFCRATGNPIYHSVGTCKMGANSDETAVVDSNLRVLGMEHLRVVDASVMPRLISGNTNAATIMLAEKGADIIKANTYDQYSNRENHL